MRRDWNLLDSSVKTGLILYVLSHFFRHLSWSYLWVFSSHTSLEAFTYQEYLVFFWCVDGAEQRSFVYALRFGGIPSLLLTLLFLHLTLLTSFLKLFPRRSRLKGWIFSLIKIWWTFKPLQMSTSLCNVCKDLLFTRKEFNLIKTAIT